MQDFIDENQDRTCFEEKKVTYYINLNLQRCEFKRVSVVKREIFFYIATSGTVVEETSQYIDRLTFPISPEASPENETKPLSHQIQIGVSSSEHLEEIKSSKNLYDSNRPR